MDITYKDFKDFKLRSIREARLDKNLTQEELAKFADIERPHLSMIESGKINPTWATSKALAKVLKENPLDIAMGQILENVEIDKIDRPAAVKMLLEDKKILMAAKNINRLEKDFGGRDGFGRKIIARQTEKDSLGRVIKSRDIKRDSFGRVIKGGE